MRYFLAATVIVAAAFFFSAPPQVEAQRVRYGPPIYLEPYQMIPCQPMYPSSPATLPPTCPNVTGQPVESKPEELPVQQPWYLSGTTDEQFLQAPPIALDPLPGTGLKLPIGVGPSKISHELSEPTIAKLKEILGQLRPPQQVPITLPLEAETTQRLSRISLLVEVLLYVLGAAGGASILGRFGPLAALVVRGLQLANQERSKESPMTPVAQSSTPAQPSSVVNPAAPSTTPKPGT